jgi:hypothetical protein
MATVWKYPIPRDPGAFELEVPASAKVLSVLQQHGDPMLWMLVERGNAKESRQFMWVETGESFPDGVSAVYVGTVLFYLGAYVLHLFEVVT